MLSVPRAARLLVARLESPRDGGEIGRSGVLFRSTLTVRLEDCAGVFRHRAFRNPKFSPPKLPISLQKIQGPRDERPARQQPEACALHWPRDVTEASAIWAAGWQPLLLAIAEVVGAGDGDVEVEQTFAGAEVGGGVADQAGSAVVVHAEGVGADVCGYAVADFGQLGK